MSNLRKVLFLLAFGFFSLGSTCHVTPIPMPIEPRDTAMCAAACDHLRLLGCPEGEDLDEHTTCETFCIRTQKNGHALRPACIVHVENCALLETSCNRPRGMFE